MHPRCRHLQPFAVLLSIAISGGRCAAADDFAAAPTTLTDGRAGVLLLQDGGVLAGKISQTPDWYTVGRAGGQMQVPTSRVQFVGRSLAEAYQYRCQHMNGDTVESHLALADWCLRYSLLDEAGKELTAARNLGPDHPRLALLDRRLSAAKEKPAASAHVATPKSAVPAGTSNATSSPMRPDVSNNVVEVFTRKVQPVLVNNCTISKCHEPGGPQAFQLNRAVVRGEANRRTTMQNLAATLALIDREHPEASPLLTVPRQSHGGMNAAIFGARQESAFKHLADWVALVAPTSPADVEQTPGDVQLVSTPPAATRTQKSKTALAKHSSTMTLSQPSLLPIGGDAADGLSSAQPIADHAVEPAAAIEDAQPKTLRSPHRLKYGLKAEKWEPRDSFDPEIFNRQMHPAAQSPAPKQQAAKSSAADAN
jgi:hypothetical protein